MSFHANRLPKNHWNDLEHQRSFFLALAKKLGIKQLDDWKEVTALQINKHGGEHILKRYYRGSLSKALKNIFPTHSWDESTFQTVPRRYWQKKENQQKFITKIANKFEIREHADWRRVTVRDINKLGGRGFLRHFNGSLWDALMHIFPEVDWKQIQLPKAPLGFWKHEENRRKYLKSIANEFNIQNPKAWSNITISQIASYSGDYPISRYYGGSIYRALSSTFPGIF